ncbi:hypothetical protein V6N12_005417 [Hibiscus sabdariffa]|uniref:Uncharacterized protein n=1 Tax=Hibiscus sabdariffa TaxID=183260 RepID=A0ABR2A887_9ROSI
MIPAQYLRKDINAQKSNSMIVGQSGDSEKEHGGSRSYESPKKILHHVQQLNPPNTSVSVDQSAVFKPSKISNLSKLNIPYYERSNSGFDILWIIQTRIVLSARVIIQNDQDVKIQFQVFPMTWIRLALTNLFRQTT